MSEMFIKCITGYIITVVVSMIEVVTGCVNDTHIYESFLNGELTVEKKGEQLYISELFWDNDIEYCFGDIDDDGSEELHIRDSAVYYKVKVCDGTPQIFFEGSRARQEENELEWTGRQLKSFATWQEAYVDFIQKLHGTIPEYNEMDYSLIYVDDNDIPELFIYTGGMATGEFVVSFYDGNIGVMNRERCGIQYIEYGGLLYNMNGNMGFNPCNIYMLENGKFSEIGTGWCSEHCDENENWYWDYYWEDSPVTEAEYMAHINELIDTSKCIEPSELYSKDEILEILADQGTD